MSTTRKTRKEKTTMTPNAFMDHDKKFYYIEVELPGVKKEDIKIDLENDYMTITAETKEEKKSTIGEEKDEKIHTSEFRYGKYVRTIGFDNPIKTDKSIAEYQNGVLHITVPKQKIEKAHAKRLTIK